MSGKMNTDKLSTPNIQASEAALILAAETAIDAPAAVAFRALRNTDTWKDWNRWVPKVMINYQPPEEDSATAQEIQALIRNTSLAGSFYSDLTDGGVGPPKKRGPDEQPPPKFRLNSVSSRGSVGSGPNRQSSEVDPLSNGGAERGSVSSTGGKSAALKYQEAQDSRRSSVASGQEPEPIVNRLENTNVHRASVAMPSPASPTSPGRSGSRKASKPKYTQVVGPTPRSMERAHHAMMSVYGEPSVRLMINTKLTFFMRMKPNSPSEYVESRIVVIDVRRPDDPINEDGITGLTRSKTHQLDRAGNYRVVWANDTENSSVFNLFKGVNVPKSMLQSERVHEIIPTGEESCIYRTWEFQKGSTAKSNKKKQGEYLQKMFEVWCSGMRDFCEGLHAPKIDRRDFSISLDEAPIIIAGLT